MKVAVIGAGGRESAIAWKLAQSQDVEQVICIPGNGGIELIDKCKCIDVEVSKNNLFHEVIKFVKDNNIEYTVVGPEVPLVDGIVDEFEKQGLKIFGPSKNAALLEGSKIFAREFAIKYNIQIPEYKVIRSVLDTFEIGNVFGFPVVVKKDGLAAGKGVFICKTEKELENTLLEHFTDVNYISNLEKDKYSDADVHLKYKEEFLCEKFLKGYEASILVLIDENYNYKPLISSMDYKKIYNKNKGPNTGGMGSIAPHPYLKKKVYEKFIDKILKPTIEGLKKEGIKYKGILYFGLIVHKNEPYLLEYNVRFGDPETQSILPLCENDFLEIVDKTINGNLDKLSLKWRKKKVCTVIAASSGYPLQYEKGFTISIDKNYFNKNESVKIFTAGVKKEKDSLITSGGRVLAVTAVGTSYNDARKKAYNSIKKVSFNKMYYRNDIGKIKFIRIG